MVVCFIYIFNFKDTLCPMEEGGSPLVLHASRGGFLGAIQVTGVFLERSPSSGSPLGALRYFTSIAQQPPNPTSA